MGSILHPTHGGQAEPAEISEAQCLPVGPVVLYHPVNFDKVNSHRSHPHIWMGENMHSMSLLCLYCVSSLCQLNKGAKSWHNHELMTTWSRDGLYKTHQKKRPHCLFQVARHNQNVNSNKSVHVWHIRIQSRYTAKLLNLLWWYFYWEPIKKLL